MNEAAGRLSIGLIGGAGKLGGGLAYRWAKAGHQVVIGSRDVARGEEAAEALRASSGGTVSAASYADTVSGADIVVLAVPFEAQEPTLAALRDAIGDRIVIDTTVALRPPAVGKVQLPAEGSAGLIARRVLAGAGRLACAFQNVAAAHLAEGHSADCDVLVCADDPAVFPVVERLASDATLRAFHAGPIENSVAVEAMTSVLITLNRRYKSPGAGIRLTGLL